MKYTLDMQPETKREFEYIVTTYHGTRADPEKTSGATYSKRTAAIADVKSL